MLGKRAKAPASHRPAHWEYYPYRVTAQPSYLQSTAPMGSSRSTSSPPLLARVLRGGRPLHSARHARYAAEAACLRWTATGLTGLIDLTTTPMTPWRRRSCGDGGHGSALKSSMRDCGSSCRRNLTLRGCRTFRPRRHEPHAGGSVYGRYLFWRRSRANRGGARKRGAVVNVKAAYAADKRMW